MVLALHTTQRGFPIPGLLPHQRAAKMIHPVLVAHVAHSWVPAESLLFPRPSSPMCPLPRLGSLPAAPLRRQTDSESAPTGPANLHSQHGNFKAFRDPKPEKPARWWRWARLSQKDTRELTTLPQKPEARAQSYIVWNHMNIYSRLGPERAPGLLETIGHHYRHPCDCEHGCWSACNHRHQKRDSCLPWWDKQQKF